MRSPKGEERPAHVMSNAVKVMRIATGDEEETVTDDGKDKAAVRGEVSQMTPSLRRESLPG